MKPTMRAYVLHGIGDLRFEEVPRPEPGPGEALLRVTACGVCGSDLPRIYEKGTYRFPTIPGHEFAGIVEAVGEGADSALIGRAAAVFPLLPCFRCPSCAIGQYATCASYDYKGSRSDGAFAEYVAVPVWNLVPAPEGLSAEELAMAEPAAVALHALRRGGIEAGDRVFVSGAGPIGLMLAQWARALGASRVLLADVDDEKLVFARKLGFDDTINPLRENLDDWIRERTPGGVDLAVEGAGASASWENCLKASRPGGRVVLMGNPAGPMGLSQHGYWEMLRKQLHVVGTWNSDYAGVPEHPGNTAARQPPGDEVAEGNDWSSSLRAMAEGRLEVKPLVTHRVRLEELGAAILLMKEKSAFSNKVMWTIPTEGANV